MRSEFPTTDSGNNIESCQKNVLEHFWPVIGKGHSRGAQNDVFAKITDLHKISIVSFWKDFGFKTKSESRKHPKILYALYFCTKSRSTGSTAKYRSTGKTEVQGVQNYRVYIITGSTEVQGVKKYRESRSTGSTGVQGVRN